MAATPEHFINTTLPGIKYPQPSLGAVMLPESPLSEGGIPPEETGGPDQLELMPHQVEHFSRLVSILKQYHGAVDTTQTGGGKTFVTMSLSLYFGLPLLVVCPSSLRAQWRTLCHQYGVKLIDAVSYDVLRGTERSGVSHPYLVRQGNNFYPSDHFAKLAEEGLIVVYDECQRAKNPNSATTLASSTLSRFVANTNSSSRILALSATPYDKPMHCASLLRLIAVVTRSKLYTYDRSSRQYELTGMKQVQALSSALDPYTAEMISGFNLKKTYIDKACHEYYTQIIKKYVSSAADSPSHEFEPDSLNKFVVIDSVCMEYLKRSEEKLARATRYSRSKDGTDNVNLKKANWGDINKAIHGLERAKLTALVRLAVNKLKQEEGNKVLLFVKFQDSKDYLHKQLTKKGFSCVIMDGRTKMDARKTIVDLFQKASTELRVFITSAIVGGVGLSLDDQHGSFPRWAYAVPNYNFIPLLQACGRIDRTNTQSQPHIRIVYSNEGNEMSILNAIVRKSATTRGTLSDNNEALFPGDYLSEVEETQDVVLLDDVDMPEWEDLFPTQQLEIASIEPMATLGPISR